MPTTSSAVLGSITAISDFLLSYAVTLAALGALTVAVIEAWKKLRNSQAKFHRSSVLRWLQNDASGKERHYFTQPTARAPNRSLPESDSTQAYGQLLHLTTGLGNTDQHAQLRYANAVAMDRSGVFHRSIEYALFELEIERLMGQIQDAADTALNNPRLYPDLFQFLTRGAQPEDVDQWLQEVGQLAVSADATQEQRKEIADRYTRLKQTVRRHLDSFQIVTALRWREWNQFAAIVVGGVLLVIAQLVALANQPDGHWKTWAEVSQQFMDAPFLWLKIAVVSLFGGMLAPVAKDLVDALRKVKSGV